MILRFADAAATADDDDDDDDEPKLQSILSRSLPFISEMTKPTNCGLHVPWRGKHEFG